MEAAVLFTPAFLFLFPRIVTGFPALTVNEAIGLALFVEFFGYTSSVTGYWFREQIDFNAAGRILVVTVPLAILARIGSYFISPGSLLAPFGLLLVGLAVGAILAPTVVVGGQVGSLLNAKMSEETAIRVMIVSYVLVGLFVLGRILMLGGGTAH